MADVTARLGAGTRVELRARHLTWVGDEPPSVGGRDEGPTPYELLLGSLAACTAITLRLYATHKGLEIPAVDVTLSYDRVHAEDCVDCDQRADGRVERIRTQVTIHGSFDAAQRTRLTQVAARCPVHKTLAGGVHFADTVQFAEPASG